MIQIRKQQFYESEESNNDDEDNEHQHVITNFLDDIKGHLEELSFETQLHDIYDPQYSDDQEIQQIQDSTQSSEIQTKQIPKFITSQQNIICSIDTFCQSIEQQAFSDNEQLKLKNKIKQLKLDQYQPKQSQSFSNIQSIYKIQNAKKFMLTQLKSKNNNEESQQTLLQKKYNNNKGIIDKPIKDNN